MPYIKKTMLIIIGFIIILLYTFEYISSRDAIIGLLFCIYVIKVISINLNQNISKGTEYE